MKNILNSSELQRKGLKQVYQVIDKYGEAILINQRTNKQLIVLDQNNPHLLKNIIKNLKLAKLKLAHKYKVEQIGIFGSYARGENKPTSDLDLLLDINIKDMNELFEIEKIIKATTHINSIDLFALNTLKQTAKTLARNEMIYV